MTKCKCDKPQFDLHLQARPKDKNNPLILRCKRCGGLPLKERMKCKEVYFDLEQDLVHLR